MTSDLLWRFCPAFVVGTVLACGPVAQGGTYYVSTTGSNTNPGTEALPWRSVQYAADNAAAGDTVYINQGTYTERVSARRSGTASAPITFAARPGHSVVLDGNAGGTVFNTAGYDYLNLSGLAVQNTGNSGQGIRVFNSNNVTIDQCRTSNTYDSGIWVRSSQFVTVTNSEIQGACRGGEESLSIALSQDIVASHNYIHNTGHEGIDVKEGSARVRIYNNYLHNVERQALYTDAWNQPTTDIHFYNNVMRDCQFGISIGAETGGLLSNVRVYNNLIYNMVGPALSVQNWGDAASAHPISDVILANNTAWNTGTSWGGGLLLENAEADGVLVRNNIFAGMADPIQIRPGERPTGLTVDHNLANNGYVLEAGWWMIADPRFADLAGEDFRLLADSAAVDAGALAGAPTFDLDSNARPYGWGVDIGAYEYVPVPEPAMGLLLCGIASITLARRRRADRDSVDLRPRRRPSRGCRSGR